MFSFKYFETQVNEKVNSVVCISCDLQNIARDRKINDLKKILIVCLITNCVERRNNILEN